MPQTLTLRKAARIRKLIEARIAELRGKAQQTSATVNVYDPKPLDAIEELAKNFETNYAKLGTLLEVLFALRKSIGATNHESGVNALLTARAEVQTKLGIIRQLSRGEARLDHHTITARLLGMASKSAAAAAYSDHVSFDVLSAETLNGLKLEERDLRIQEVTITDKIEQLNNTATIEISDNDVALLTAEGVL